ncbi:uncharacterized protein LOC134739139 [Pongo pygmaeus]|uniref:uncharacterized protein LOC134739139 n=1 Tax=Pongo pygmaeus TaxID=9600 RepID=UPI00300C7478
MSGGRGEGASAPANGKKGAAPGRGAAGVPSGVREAERGPLREVEGRAGVRLRAGAARASAAAAATGAGWAPGSYCTLYSRRPGPRPGVRVCARVCASECVRGVRARAGVGARGERPENTLVCTERPFAADRLGANFSPSFSAGVCPLGALELPRGPQQTVAPGPGPRTGELPRCHARVTPRVSGEEALPPPPRSPENSNTHLRTPSQTRTPTRALASAFPRRVRNSRGQIHGWVREPDALRGVAAPGSLSLHHTHFLILPPSEAWGTGRFPKLRFVLRRARVASSLRPCPGGRWLSVPCLRAAFLPSSLRSIPVPPRRLPGASEPRRRALRAGTTAVAAAPGAEEFASCRGVAVICCLRLPSPPPPASLLFRQRRARKLRFLLLFGPRRAPLPTCCELRLGPGRLAVTHTGSGELRARKQSRMPPSHVFASKSLPAAPPFPRSSRPLTRKFARGRERAANERAGRGQRRRGPWCCRRLLRGREGGAPTPSPDSAGMPEEHSGFPLKGVCTFKPSTLHHWLYVDLRV